MNYATLKADIAAFLNRSDLESVVPTFVRLTESRINRIVRSPKMESRVVATVSTQFVNLPDDFLEMRNIQVNSTPVTPVEYLTPQQADKERRLGKTGTPNYFTIVSDRLELIPPPAGKIVVEMVYYKPLPSLSDTIQSNWFIQQYYDVYLYGALTQAALYLKDDPTSWATLFDSAIDEINVENQRSQFQGTTPTLRGTRIG